MVVVKLEEVKRGGRSGKGKERKAKVVAKLSKKGQLLKRGKRVG